VTWISALCALVVASLAVGANAALHTHWLSVRHVTISGNVHESAAEILAASDLSLHPAMIDVDTTEVARRLAHLPWVARALVLEHWPDAISIAVTERIPVAVAYGEHRSLELVDRSGRVIVPVTGSADLPLLIAQGVRAGEPWAFTRWARSAPLVAAQLPTAFASQVAAVRVNRSGVVSLAMTSPISFVLGPANQLRDKFVAVASMIKNGHLSAGDVVDVSVPSTVAISGP
jgi:cell division protein FtsQ